MKFLIWGGTSEEFFIESNSEWVAEIIDNNTNAGFNGNVNSKRITGNGAGSLVVDFAPLKEAGITSYAVLKVTLNDSDISEDIRIDQKSILSTTALTVLTNTNGVSTLAAPKNTHYYKYVYQLGENMRNDNLFGMNGTVYMPGDYDFQQAGFTAGNVAMANIYQVVSVPTSAEFANIKAEMQNDDSKLVIISHREGTIVNKSLNGLFPNAGYTVVNTGIGKSSKRYFNKSSYYSNHPVINYLLEKGPFANDVRLNPEDIWMYGKESVNAGLSKWPETFVPVIMVNNSKGLQYCVFGIDPVNRMIWISDPAIFGSSTSLYANYLNYQSNRPENMAFLNNLIAWITNAALSGDEFLKDFR